MMLSLRLSSAYMARRKVRTVLTTLAIFFGVLVIFSTMVSMPEARRLIEQGMATQENSNVSAADTEATLGVVTATFAAFGAIALFVGAFLIYNTFRTIVVERQRDLAMLRTLSAERQQILRLIVTEALVQGAVGSALGIVAGWLVAWWSLVWIYNTGTVTTITETPGAPALDAPALLGLVNTLTISILERTREFGTLRAIGGEHGQMRRVVLAEVLLLGSLGAAVGLVVGIGLGFGLMRLWGATGVPTVGGLYFVFPLAAVLVGTLGGLLLVLLTSSLPARRAANLNIADALRYE